MHHYKYKFALDLYQAIAEGKHDPTEIKEILTQPKEEEKTAVPENLPKDIRITHPKK